jgi:exodeoxyribonuclease V alpha subunit
MNSIISYIKSLQNKSNVQAADVEFMYLWAKLDPEITKEHINIFTASFHYSDQGHVAIDQDMINSYLKSIGLAEIDSLHDSKNNSLLVGNPGAYTLFIYWDGLLYQHKSFEQERALSKWLIEKSTIKLVQTKDLSEIEKITVVEDENDLQQLAIRKSLTNPLLFITGGPGTGKTYTVKQIIKAHKQIFGESFIIKIAAPTGKAAQRINDSFLDEEDSGYKAQTIHQLLGAGNLIDGFRYHHKNPIVADLIIIDEASMMDLGLWYSLTEAISSKTKLIIVGDPFQLASVESGSVLNDICALQEESDTAFFHLQNSTIELEKRHRFKKGSGIQLFANAINRMSVEDSFNVLTDSTIEDVKWIESNSKNMEMVLKEYAINPTMNNVEKSISEFKILTALRGGKYGCTYLNNVIEKDIKKTLEVAQTTNWFKNRIIMVNKNDYRLGIQNGEIGYFDEVNKSVHFLSQKNIQVDQLKNYESGYCITTHKSQGSEYENVAIVLPDYENPVLSKELLYTAVTRARKSVLVVGNKKILTHCIANKTKRKSGLSKQLRTLQD